MSLKTMHFTRRFLPAHFVKCGCVTQSTSTTVVWLSLPTLLPATNSTSASNGAVRNTAVSLYRTCILPTFYFESTGLNHAHCNVNDNEMRRIFVLGEICCDYHRLVLFSSLHLPRDPSLPGMCTGLHGTVLPQPGL